jgi:CubicO group peptidase (beta-lactamase class C family)
MNHDGCRTRAVGVIVLSVVVWGFFVPVRADVPQTGCCKRNGLDPKIEAAIDEFRASVPGIMDKGDIPGVAMALVDDKGILWTEGFGSTDGKRSPPVTPDTPFLLCGISKLITATAAMLAVQDGLVKLDEPIATYLPDFKINSRYEEHSAQKITLRRLLNFTAGLPVESPLGNYFEPASTASFEDHVKSLDGTWLVCPVGSSFYHSDASSDLAAYAIRVVAGKPFKDYLQERLFAPLRMANTTADRQKILENPQRAIGHMMAMAKMPAVYPALGAGSIYSTASDLARLVQLHINQGTLEGCRFVDRSLMETIHAPVGIARNDPNVYYGQGVYIDKRPPERTETVLWHDGWGFGFLSLLHWYPEYGIGMVVLTNRLPNPVLADLGLALTDKLVKGKLVAKRFLRPEPDYRGCVGAWWGWPEHRPTPYQGAWRQYCGTHNLRFSEYSLEWWAHVAVLIVGRDEYTPRIHIREKDGFLCVTESKFFEQICGFRSVDEKLQEVRPGVFATKGGGTLDFASEVPTWRNNRLEKR